jgi:hypothetical protein
MWLHKRVVHITRSFIWVAVSTENFEQIHLSERMKRVIDSQYHEINDAVPLSFIMHNKITNSPCMSHK